MKFSIDWLKKFVDIKGSAKNLSDAITVAGLEVETISVDGILDVKVTPNRADCLGMIGLARDCAAITNASFTEPKIKNVPAVLSDKININVEDSVACPKYLGRVIKGLDNTRQTPQWIKDCLTIAGMKLISPIVDITNYVLLEWGQPLHAFDLANIAGDIVVRRARAGEKLQLLDESEVALNPESLVIADSKKPLALAGIKGGFLSGITQNTKDILVECAYFEPVGVRLNSRHFGIKSDASHRYERGIDPTMQEKVLEHATNMIIEIVGGTPGPVNSYVEHRNLPTTVVLHLRLSRIKKVLGIDIDAVTVTKILQNLSFQVETHNGNDELMVTVPSFRTDVTREVDLIEEVARIYGFDNIAPSPTVSTLQFLPAPEGVVREEALRNCLAQRGYHEAITYSFINYEYAKLFSRVIEDDLKLSNPISSEMDFMRPSLLPGLVKALQYNQNRQQDRVRLFEIGLRFGGTMNNLQQRNTVAGVCYGNYLPEGWGNPRRLADIFDVKGDVMALLELGYNEKHVKFTPAADLAMHPGQALDVYLHDKLLGKIGALHPQLQQSLELPNPVIMFELDYEMLSQGQIAQFSSFAKFPSVRRDIAIIVDKKLPVGNIKHAIREEIPKLLTDIVVFDVYQGKGIDVDKKSIALGLTLQNIEATLTDEEVQNAMNDVISMLQREFKAVLRE